MHEQVPRVVIGMDPHKRTVTIEVMTADETVVGGGRFDTTVEATPRCSITSPRGRAVLASVGDPWLWPGSSCS